MSVRQTLAITDDQLCELMETFSSVSVACRVMSSDCVRRRDRSLGVPPFTHSKPVIGGSHIFCCHSSDVIMSPVNFKNVLMLCLQKKQVFPFTLLIYLNIVTGMKIDWDMAVLFSTQLTVEKTFQEAVIRAGCKCILSA